jgi:hypothetical protein
MRTRARLRTIVKMGNKSAAARVPIHKAGNKDAAPRARINLSNSSFGQTSTQ